ncbi:hypothetical protein cand_019180 [Cryptosporidium andersoni]|uniref:Uncharacterized protein n=1 Tax=Cryptosporidium andersoni TaxID=117008 RepID=A0A1J4MAT4_9CRYT|nr:hypothetical protein cand_019180 [Cryptosporidium andersoni]
MVFIPLLYISLFVSNTLVYSVLCRTSKYKFGQLNNNLTMKELDDISTNELYGSEIKVDLSLTIDQLSELSGHSEIIFNSLEFDSVLELKDTDIPFQLSPTEDILPLRNKELNELYLKSIEKLDISPNRQNLHDSIIENYHKSHIIPPNEASTKSEVSLSNIQSLLRSMSTSMLPFIDEKEITETIIDERELQNLNNTSFQSEKVVGRFGDILGILSSIPFEMRADILANAHEMIQKSGKNINNLPDIFYGSGIKTLLQPLNTMNMEPTELLGLYSTLFEENVDNFLLFLSIIEKILLRAISTSNVVPPLVARKLKQSSSGQDNNFLINKVSKQQSAQFWLNTICQTIYNIRILKEVYPYIIASPIIDEMNTPTSSMTTPGTPLFQEFQINTNNNSALLNSKQSTNSIGDPFTAILEVIFNGWKSQLENIGYVLKVSAQKAIAVCKQCNLIRDEEHLKSMDSHHVRKFKALIKKTTVDSDENTPHFTNEQLLKYMDDMKITKSFVMLSTDSRQVILSTTTTYLISIADLLSELQMISQCYSDIEMDSSLNKNKTFTLSSELKTLLKSPSYIQNIPLLEWRTILLDIPEQFKTACVIAIHNRYISYYRKFKKLHYTLQQPTAITNIILKLQSSPELIGENTAKLVNTAFSWKSLYQADSTFSFFFSLLDLNQLLNFNKIIEDVISEYVPIQDSYAIPNKDTSKYKMLKLWNRLKDNWIFKLLTFGFFSIFGYIDNGYTTEECLFIPKSKQGEPEPTIIW